MKINITVSFFLVVMLFSASGCSTTFKGKIIDADTKEPLEDVVVVSAWSEETTYIGATHSRLKEVKEVLTNKNGEWEIKGPRGMGSDFMETVMSIVTLTTGAYYTRPPDIIFFKPGYCSYPNGLGILACREKMTFIKDTLELPKLLDRSREAFLLNIPSLTSDARAKLPIYQKLLDLYQESER